MAKSKYSIEGLRLAGGRFGGDPLHDLDETLFLCKSDEGGLGLDFVVFSESLIQRSIEIGNGQLFLAAGSVDFSEVETDGGIIPARGLN